MSHMLKASRNLTWEWPESGTEPRPENSFNRHYGFQTALGYNKDIGPRREGRKHTLAHRSLTYAIWKTWLALSWACFTVTKLIRLEPIGTLVYSCVVHVSLSTLRLKLRWFDLLRISCGLVVHTNPLIPRQTLSWHLLYNKFNWKCVAKHVARPA